MECVTDRAEHVASPYLASINATYELVDRPTAEDDPRTSRRSCGSIKPGRTTLAVPPRFHHLAHPA
jgi:hypothetical protein